MHIYFIHFSCKVSELDVTWFKCMGKGGSLGFYFFLVVVVVFIVVVIVGLRHISLHAFTMN